MELRDEVTHHLEGRVAVEVQVVHYSQAVSYTHLPAGEWRSDAAKMPGYPPKNPTPAAKTGRRR